MKRLWLPLVSCLILGSLPLTDAHAQQWSVVRVALPGTIEPVILDHIGPAFTAASGYPLELSRAPSIALTNRIVSGGLHPRCDRLSSSARGRDFRSFGSLNDADLLTAGFYGLIPKAAAKSASWDDF